ncbi:MAG TPA: hypothetical protein VG034_23755 [Acidimicrobiia bacterium]|jgi:hypothetical protein|nr:hypothetical protein [Acidimicrobiia bacterium]
MQPKPGSDRCPPALPVQPQLATVFDADELQAVGRHNALAQFPRLAAALGAAR